MRDELGNASDSDHTVKKIKMISRMVMEEMTSGWRRFYYI